MARMTDVEAVRIARDEIEKNSCLSDDDAQHYAEGIIDGVVIGYGGSVTGAMNWFGPEDRIRRLVRSAIERHHAHN